MVVLFAFMSRFWTVLDKMGEVRTPQVKCRAAAIRTAFQEVVPVAEDCERPWASVVRH